MPRNSRDWYTVPKSLLTDGNTVGIGSAVYPDSGQPEKTTLGAIADFVNEQAPPTGIIQAGTDRRLYDQSGNRIYLRGVHAFNHCFAIFSDGYRFDWRIRFSQSPVNIPIVSPPIHRGTPYGEWLSYAYVNDATARQYISYLKGIGFNTIRLWVGIGMIQTAPFTDKVTGLSFPSELEILDNIVQSCAEFGMYTWMTYAHGSVPNDQTADFWAIIADRYKIAGNVILDIENEPASGTVFITPSNPLQTTPYATIMPSSLQWAARYELCLAAIRNAGFLGPVACAPYHNLWSIDTIQPFLLKPPFSTDPNLIIDIHIYYIFGDTPTTFASQRQGLLAHTYNFTRYFCVVCSEFGFTNSFNFIDPAPALAYNKAALGWLQQEGFNGQINFVMQPQFDDLNDLFDNTTQFVVPGNPTVWGQAVLDYNEAGNQGLAKSIPTITSTSGPPTDTTGTVITFSRSGARYDMTLSIAIVTNGTAAGTLLALLPSPAPSSAYQDYTAFSSAGTIVRVRILGMYAEITNLDGSYPGADGVTITGNVTYYASNEALAPGASLDPNVAAFNSFSYQTQHFDGTYWYTRGGLITGLPDGQQGTIITTLDFTGGDGTQMRVCSTNNSRFSLLRNIGGKIQLQLRNAANDIIGQALSTVSVTTPTVKQTLFISWDLSVPVIRLFLKGVNFLDPDTYIAIDDTIDYTDSNWSLGADPVGGQSLLADMDFFWFHNIFMEPGNYVNNGSFFDMFDVPVDVGHYGDALIGQRPLIFMRNLTPATTFADNFGTGGGMTLNP